jgi:peptide/nickel transport system permease protein
MRSWSDWYERHKEDYLFLGIRGLKKSKLGIVGGLIVFGVVMLAILAPWVSPYDPIAFNTKERLSPPSWRHPFGTDFFGRDILSRIIWGARMSIIVGIISVSIGFTLGTVIGAISGYYGGIVDEVLGRIMDMLLAFPAILLALLIVAVLGPSLENLMVAIGIVYIPRFGRIVRGSVLAVRNAQYIEAAKSVGKSDRSIIWSEIIPNCVAPIIVNIAICFAIAILSEGALSFLGLGIQPPTPSWGNMLSDSRRFIESAPWTVVFPGLAITVTVLGLNLFGDGLRDAFDPRLRVD